MNWLDEAIARTQIATPIDWKTVLEKCQGIKIKLAIKKKPEDPYKWKSLYYYTNLLTIKGE